MATLTTNLSLTKPEATDTSKIREDINSNSDLIDAQFADTYLAPQAKNAVSITGGSITGITDLAVADGGTGSSTAANARTALGLAIGTNVQAYDATLLSLALLGTAADKIAYTTNVDTWAETALTAFGRSILDDADEATFKATVNLEIGTDVQAYDASLTSIAALTYVSGSFIALTAEDTYTVRTYAQVLSDIGAANSGANSSITSLTGLTTPLSFAQGGTGIASWTQYLIPYADTTTSLSQIAIGTDGQVLTSGGAGVAPSFEDAAAGYTNLTSFVAQTAWRLFYSNTDGDVTELALGTDGQVLTSSGVDSAPAFEDAAAGGEINTASNIGDQVEIFKQKSTYDLEFKTLLAGSSKLTIVDEQEAEMKENNAVDSSDIKLIDANSRKGQYWKASSTYTLGQIIIYMRKLGDPGDVILEVTLADGSHKPTGGVLATKTLTQGDINTSNGYVTFDIGSLAITQNTEYCWYLKCAGAVEANHEYILRYKSDTNPLADSDMIGSTDAGSNWTVYTNNDVKFQLWTAAVPLDYITFDVDAQKVLDDLTLTESDISDLGTAAALVADKLSVFAATSSSELAGVISDEIGTGKLRFDTAVTAKTTTATLNINEAGTILVSAAGGAYTITLPTASGNTGLTYHFIKTDANYTLITLDGDGTETFNYENSTGAPVLTYARLNTYCAEVTIVSDGANWQVINERLGLVPYCWVYLNADQLDITNTTFIRVDFNTKSFDIGSNFDNSVWVSGNATSTSAGHLVDAGGAFTSTMVNTRVKNTTDSVYTYVTAYNSATDLTVRDDIFVNTEGYEIKNAKFVVPIPGIYQINSLIRYTNTLDAKVWYLNIRYQAAYKYQGIGHSGSTSDVTVIGNIFGTLAIGDTVEAYAYHNAGVNTPDIDGGAVGLTNLIVKLVSKD